MIGIRKRWGETSPSSRILGNLHPGTDALGMNQERYSPRPHSSSKAALLTGFPTTSTQSPLKPVLAKVPDPPRTPSLSFSGG